MWIIQTYNTKVANKHFVKKAYFASFDVKLGSILK